MSTHAINQHDASPSRVSAVAVQQMRWLAGGLALGFLVPFVFADQLGLQRDLYYGDLRRRLRSGSSALGAATDSRSRTMIAAAGCSPSCSASRAPA